MVIHRSDKRNKYKKQKKNKNNLLNKRAKLKNKTKTNRSKKKKKNPNRPLHQHSPPNLNPETAIQIPSKADISKFSKQTKPLNRSGLNSQKISSLHHPSQLSVNNNHFKISKRPPQSSMKCGQTIAP